MLLIGVIINSISAPEKALIDVVRPSSPGSALGILA